MIDRRRFTFTWMLIVGLISSFCFSYTLANQSLIVSAQEILSPTDTIVQDFYLPPRKDFRVVVISDLNSQYGSTEYEPEVDRAIALLPEWQPDLVLCGGDMIAGQKASLTQSQIEAMWTAFDQHVAAPLRRYNIPFGFTIGNHDGSGAIKNQALIFENERDLAKAYWSQKQHKLGLDFVDRANFPFYYSFHKNSSQKNDIFFLVWDASTHIISEQQLAWVKEALNSEAAQQASMSIAIGHLPLYPVAAAKNKPGEYLANGQELRSLLEKNHVHLYISGHHHAYYPGKKGELELLHAGALGQGARQLIHSDALPHQTITIVDLDLTKTQLVYTTYDPSSWEIISLEELPLSITGENGTIFRHDF